MPVYPGVRHGYMPVGPRLRPGVTLHYKFRIKTWSNVSFLLSLSHNSYVFKEITPNRHKLDCTATNGRWRLENSDEVTRGIMIYVAKTNA